jgi:hypothetical protein
VASLNKIIANPALKKLSNPTFGDNLADYNASGFGSPVGVTAGAGITNPALKSITLGGGTHDYAFDILNDPAYKQLRDSLSAAGIADASHLRGAIQQALIGFGAVPNLPAEVLQNTGLDTAGTQALADNNPFSTLKRLQQTYQDSQDATKNQLAARGILNSGETGFQLGRLGQTNAQNTYDATSGLLGSIGSLNDQYAAGRQAAAQQLAQGAFSAESNAAASNAGAAPGITATWNPATGTYVDPAGNHYDQGGNPISMPGSTPPPLNTGVGVSGLAPIQQLPDNRPIVRPGQLYAA